MLLTNCLSDTDSIAIVAIPGGLAEVTIPEGVNQINYDAFAGCYNLTHVTIPASVTEIALDTFADCPLESLTIDLGNPRYFVEDNYLCDRETGERYTIIDDNSCTQ